MVEYSDSNPSGQWNGFTSFENIYIINHNVGITFAAASNWTLRDSIIANCTNAGLVIENLGNPDTGDSVIEGCFFITNSTAVTYAILYESSGGLKCVGNKFLNHSYAIDLAIADGASTSDLIITGNSIENQLDTGIRLRISNASGTGKFQNVVITGNQFSINNGGGNCVQIYSWAGRGSTAAIKNVAINGNVFVIGATSGTSTGINAQYGYNVNVVGNVFYGGGGSTVGINLSGNSDTSQSDNIFRGLTTNLIT